MTTSDALARLHEAIINLGEIPSPPPPLRVGSVTAFHAYLIRTGVRFVKDDPDWGMNLWGSPVVLDQRLPRDMVRYGDKLMRLPADSGAISPLGGGEVD